MKYCVNEDGVAAMQAMVTATTDAMEGLYNNTASLHRLAQEAADLLGPHKASLNDALENIYQGIKDAAGPLTQVTSILQEVVDAYREIMAYDRFAPTGGRVSENAGGSGGAASPAQRAQAVETAGKEWASSLSPESREAVKSYTGTAYANINATLRGLEKTFHPGNYERALSLHQALQAASIPVDCTVYRGVSAKALGVLQMMPDSMLAGRILEDPGFMSASLDENSAFGGNVLLVIDVPRGSHGAYVGDISSAGHYEREVLLDAGQTMRILDVSRDAYGRRIIHVTLMR